MLQLNPNETYKINRILKDWADNTTYYVQAKVYDAVTRSLLATKSLTDNGSRWFSSDYKVPDTGQSRDGRRLIVITSVYTDSGYSTRSNNHYDEVEEVLVQQRFDAAVMLGGGSGNTDFESLLAAMKKMITEAVKPAEIEVDGEIVPQDPLDLIIDKALAAHFGLHIPRIHEALKGVSEQISSLPAPKDPEKVDLAPIVSALETCLQEIRAIPTPERVNFAPHLADMTQLLNQLRAALVEDLSSEQEPVPLSEMFAMPARKSKSKGLLKRYGKE